LIYLRDNIFHKIVGIISATRGTHFYHVNPRYLFLIQLKTSIMSAPVIFSWFNSKTSIMSAPARTYKPWIGNCLRRLQSYSERSRNARLPPGSYHL